MTETNFRVLCAELVDIATAHCNPDDYAIGYCAAVLAHARAALARPEPAPTDEEIMELMPQQMRDDLANAARALAGFDRANVKAAGAMRIILNRQAVNHARAVLARWGTPAIAAELEGQ
jgi:hypothetical protein